MVRRPAAAHFLGSKTNQLEEQGPVLSLILHAVNPAFWNKGIPGKPIIYELACICTTCTN